MSESEIQAPLQRDRHFCLSKFRPSLRADTFSDYSIIFSDFYAGFRGQVGEGEKENRGRCTNRRRNYQKNRTWLYSVPSDWYKSMGFLTQLVSVLGEQQIVNLLTTTDCNFGQIKKKKAQNHNWLSPSQTFSFGSPLNGKPGKDPGVKYWIRIWYPKK